MRHWDPIADELAESIPKLFLGRRLAAIRYYEFDHESECIWGQWEAADTLDLAGDLIWDDGSAVNVSTKSRWDTTTEPRKAMGLGTLAEDVAGLRQLNPTK